MAKRKAKGADFLMFGERVLTVLRDFGARFLITGSRHTHHCGDCDTVMICRGRECDGIEMYCSVCSEKPELGGTFARQEALLVKAKVCRN